MKNSVPTIAKRKTRLTWSGSEKVRRWHKNGSLVIFIAVTAEHNSDFFLSGSLRCGSVVEWLGSRTCDQQVEGSNPSRRNAECNPGKVVYTHVPLSPSSIIWYQPMSGDARQLGR